MVVFYVTGIYRGFWQYISTRDVFQYARSSLYATLLAIAGVTLLFRFNDFSKGVFIIDWILTTVFLLGSRGSFRIFTETMKRKTLAGDHVIIYGAGRGGELLLREILNNKALNINPVGFLDDDPLKSGKKIQGFPILGNFDKLSELQKKHTIRGVLLSFSDPANSTACQAAAQYCRQNGLFLKKFAIQLKSVDLMDKE
jgi:UDP-GlcNAc:undecaprenyl-phosphate GlcNAc-1-phosphate transferase